MKLPGPCASFGTQVNRPLVGSMPAPSGALTREKVRASRGRSGSVAAAVKLSKAPSSTERSPMAASTGASLTSTCVDAWAAAGVGWTLPTSSVATL